MHEQYFLDIPVYRITEEQYYKELDAYIEKVMYPGPQSNDDDMKRFHKKHPVQKKNFEQHIRETYGGVWNYNEIIGWVQLHFLGSQIRGEFWRVKAKRLVRSRKKVFEYHAWKLAPEIDIPHEADNMEILDLINEYLSDCRKELKGRYFDTKRLDVIGPYVDWRSLMKKRENV